MTFRPKRIELWSPKRLNNGLFGSSAFHAAARDLALTAAPQSS